jgi:hypothetical protein
MSGKTWTDRIELAPGIFLYKNVFKKEMNINQRLESVLSEESNPYEWQEALVGYKQKMPEYRDCVDFKYNKQGIEHNQDEATKTLIDLWQDCYDVQYPAVLDYRGHHNIMDLKYWEAMNFIRYGKGQHFMEHHDHGFSYNCTVSLVGYTNDDYEGGELYFRTWDLSVKPEAGDLFIFPSNFMYPHRAMEVTEGTKYSIVTMLDYSDKYHKAEFYEDTDT